MTPTPTRTPTSWARLVVLVVALGVGACAPDTGPPGHATVARIIDGDTVEVTLATGNERVRLLNIDTPETVHPTEPVECFGPEATEAITQLIPPGTEVRLERDVEARDTFGRLLAHIHRVDDDLFVNLEMVRLGYAEVLVIPPNDTNAPRFRVAEQEARAAGRGLWSACR